jgi:hypothetical protein
MAEVRWVESGCYVYRFGWLTIPSEELAIWRQIPERCVLVLQNVQIENQFRPSASALGEEKIAAQVGTGLLQNYTI